MKWKRNIGKIINGFEIIDSYIIIGDNGGKLTRVKLKCSRCGTIFERSQAVSIENIKCKCMCVNYGKPEPIPRSTYEYQGKQYHLHYVCVCCGTSFDSNHPKARFCSDNCRKAAARLERRKKLKSARERGEFDVSVTLENVYEKFGGNCVCCGKPLKYGDSPLAEDYPTIDHIKPLSKGGAHLWNNVQLMCRACNMSKGAKYDDRQAEETA